MEVFKAYAFAIFTIMLGFYGYDSAMTASGPFIGGYIGAGLPVVPGIGMYAVGLLNGKDSHD